MGLFNFLKKDDNNDLNFWNNIEDVSKINALLDLSEQKPQLIFKHSTRCSISTTAKSRLERGWEILEGKVDGNFLDLIAFRSISNSIAEQLGVTHASPQAIILKNRKVVYSSSHLDIIPEEILKVIEA